ncbi:hypothetical protein C3492_36015 [Streptomyces sp. Ru62]|nr:hypothetical protein C3492_36015 [Streptomyces sp. Ru62]
MPPGRAHCAAAAPEARRPVCKRCGQKFTDQCWEETTAHRTAWKAGDSPTRCTLGAGSGIVADSGPGHGGPEAPRQGGGPGPPHLTNCRPAWFLSSFSR